MAHNPRHTPSSQRHPSAKGSGNDTPSLPARALTEPKDVWSALKSELCERNEAWRPFFLLPADAKGFVRMLAGVGVTQCELQVVAESMNRNGVFTAEPKPRDFFPELEKTWGPIFRASARDTLVSYLRDVAFPQAGREQTGMGWVELVSRLATNTPVALELETLRAGRADMPRDGQHVILKAISFCSRTVCADVHSVISCCINASHGPERTACLSLIQAWNSRLDLLTKEAAVLRPEETDRLLQNMSRALAAESPVRALSCLYASLVDPLGWMHETIRNTFNQGDLPRDRFNPLWQRLFLDAPFFREYPTLKQRFLASFHDAITEVATRPALLNFIPTYYCRAVEDMAHAFEQGRHKAFFENWSEWMHAVENLQSEGLTPLWCYFDRDRPKLAEAVRLAKGELQAVENALFHTPVGAVSRISQHDLINTQWVMAEVLQFIALGLPGAPLEKISRQIIGGEGPHRSSDIADRLREGMGQTLVRELLKEQSAARSADLTSAYREILMSDGLPTRITLSDGTPNPIATKLQKDASSVLLRALLFTESFSAFTVDARHTPDGEVPLLARFLIDAAQLKRGSAQAWCVNSRRHDTYPGRGMGARIDPLRILAHDSDSDDPLEPYKQKWRHLSPQALDRVHGADVFFLRGCVVLNREGAPFSFAGTPMSLLVRNDHYFNNSFEGSYLVPTSLVLPAITEARFSLEDGARFHPSFPVIQQEALHIPSLRRAASRLHLPFLELTRAVNLFGSLAKAPLPGSAPYHLRERELEGDPMVADNLVTDVSGHVHHAFWRDGKYDWGSRNLEELENSLAPAREAANEVYRLATQYFDLLDVVVALRAYWGQYGRALDSNDLNIGMDGPRAYQKYANAPRVPSGEYMMREAWRYHGMSDAPIIVAVDQRHFGTSLDSPWYIDPSTWSVVRGGDVLAIPEPRAWPDPRVKTFWERELASRITQVHLLIGVERSRIPPEIMAKFDSQGEQI